MAAPALNPEVTSFLDALQHPLRREIEQLRMAVLSAHDGLAENIKWNSPNFTVQGEDRLTLRVHPPRQIQLIFHRGAKKQPSPKEPLLSDGSGLLTWKETDRAVATFRSMAEIEEKKAALQQLVVEWIRATS